VIGTHETHHARLLMQAAERLTLALRAGQISLPAARPARVTKP
jgi:hypothetical protein